VLVHREVFDTKDEAMVREQFLKLAPAEISLEKISFQKLFARSLGSYPPWRTQVQACLSSKAGLVPAYEKWLYFQRQKFPAA
jgi:hypothetical protein